VVPFVAADAAASYPSIPLLIVGVALVAARLIPLGTLLITRHSASHGVFGGPVVPRQGESVTDTQGRAEALSHRRIERLTRRRPLFWSLIGVGVLITVASALV
jgi:hypothetical protein